jgi:hypothetical protein
MTPEEELRLRKLPTLIAAENDPEKMRTLAAELRRLLDRETAERNLGRRNPS